MDTMSDRPGCLSGGEWITLLGMVLAVMSAALTWSYDPPQTSSMVGAVYIAQHTGNAYYRTGYDLRMAGLRVGWVVVGCATAGGALLLLHPYRRVRPLFLTLQVALGLAVVAIAILHRGPHAGILAATIGGLLLVWGAVLRYGSDGPESGIRKE